VWGGREVPAAELLVDRVGDQADLHSAGCQLCERGPPDKWVPVLPNLDAALYLAICHQCFKSGAYDKEYLETHAYGSTVRGY